LVIFLARVNIGIWQCYEEIANHHILHLIRNPVRELTILKINYIFISKQMLM